MKEELRELVLSLGADLCGFADMDRFYSAPEGFHPTDIFPDCKSVISFAIVLPKGLFRVEPRLIYGYYNDLSCSQVDVMALAIAKIVEEQYSGLAVPIPCNSPYEYWKEETCEGRGLLSMKHLAVQAGLGSLGKNTLFLNERYGNMLTLGAVLTDLEIKPDAISQSICIPGCRKCVDACPVGAIGNRTVNQKTCRWRTYGRTARGFDTVECNFCRTVCPIAK